MLPSGGASFLHRILRARGRNTRAAAPLGSMPDTAVGSEPNSASFSVGVLIGPIRRGSRTPWSEGRRLGIGTEELGVICQYRYWGQRVAFARPICDVAMFPHTIDVGPAGRKSPT